jgi:hypothetical protein
MRDSQADSAASFNVCGMSMSLLKLPKFKISTEPGNRDIPGASRDKMQLRWLPPSPLSGSLKLGQPI